MRFILLVLLLAGCMTPTPPPAPPAKECAPIHYNVTVAQFASCWTICGKGAKLKSMTERACECVDGRKYLHAFAIDPNGSIAVTGGVPASSPTPNYEAGNIPDTSGSSTKASQSIFDMVKRMCE